MEEGSEKNPDVCFQLVDKVGSSGRYQFLSLIIWCFQWYVTGTILSGTPFLVYDPPYNCPSLPNEQQCLQYVCSLEESKRSEYLPKDALSTVANSFGDYHCSASILELISSLVYLGSFFGYVLISPLIDNIGRKKSFLISFGIATAGMILVGCAQNLVMVGIGLFFAGFGANSTVNICFYFITETVENQKRQKYCVLIQFCFGLGGIINIAYYYFIQKWRIIYWAFFIIPSLLIMVATAYFVEETPFFLVTKYTSEEALASMKKISKINGVECNTEELLSTINSLKNELVNNRPQKKSKLISPLDLFKHKSIRKISIFVCLVSFIIYSLYYGPLFLISKFPLSIYVNALVVTCSALLVYPLFYYKVEKMQRRKTGLILFSVSLACSLFLTFFNSDCSGQKGFCFQGIIELIFIFIFRFSISLEFALFLVFSNEIFPTQIRGMGIGISSALGTIASSSTPYLVGSIQMQWIIMLVFVILSVCSILMVFYLPQTLNKPIEDEIEELKGKENNENGNDNQNENKSKHIELIEEGIQSNRQ